MIDYLFLEEITNLQDQTIKDNMVETKHTQVVRYLINTVGEEIGFHEVSQQVFQMHLNVN
ncbi:hypothetical protein CPT_Moabite_031 [Serratia phage Moabite]|uniref:Uncharacterized protein n=1 Tax=Serratia phage Moabite TaxID=2587814 RepID=A0A4Y5TQ16_9CAUD|nr:hypothetical protein HWC48_gp031 [Serratia phage Moabite]QDB71063.1 hypothetical protein CPT_Moabite_031 [Serratia phage Moabite]UGO54248.1 hypothetical protein HAYMO_266 [Serratia phage vB_SmaM_Haymo]